MNSARIAVLLVNLGTPDAPTQEAVKPYLRQFLSDPRVIEVNPLLWKFILNCIILPRRSGHSAQKYAKVWTKQGSPLLVHTRKLAEKLQGLYDLSKTDVQVAYAMRYGNPSLETVFRRLHEEEGIQKILVVPMYPQYSATTTASVTDMLCDTLKKMRSQPEVRIVRDYYEHPAYLTVIENSLRNLWKQKGAPDSDTRVVLSFHGMPVSYCKKGDPYQQQVMATGALLRGRLGLSEEQMLVTFQSRFGKDIWLQPYTEPTLRELAQKGIKRVDILCPGFAADCLETLEEINMDCRNVFLNEGGEEFNFISCVNSGDSWAEALKTILESHLQNW